MGSFKCNAMLSEEMRFFNHNQAILARWYPQSFLVIKENRAYGGFPSIQQAYASALKKFEIATFLVIKTNQKFCLNHQHNLPVEPGWASILLARLFQLQPK